MNEYYLVWLKESGVREEDARNHDYMVWMSRKREEFARITGLQKLPYGGYAKPTGMEEKFSHWLKTGELPQNISTNQL